MTGLSRPTIYKRLKKAGWESGRKRRADKGEVKCGLTQGELERIADLQQKSKRRNKRIIMPTEVAVDILRRSGEIGAEASLATIRRHLRRRGLSRAQMEAAWTTDDHQTPTFHTQLKSKYPNHLHQFDITPCVQYYFGPKGLKQRDLNLQLYGTKMAEYRKVKRHLLRYVLMDHCSGALYVRYFNASGERAADVIRFLWEAWRGQESDLERYPFRGAPEILYLDKGAANLAGYTQTLMDNLGIKMIPHKPGNPRAKGGVEGTMIFWEGQFESRLALKSAPDLETLNAWALDYCIYLNATKEHKRHGHTRSAAWAGWIRQEKLRLPPDWEVFQSLAHSRPVVRTIGRDKMIRYKGQAYLVLDAVNVFDRAEVSHDPYNYPEIRCDLLTQDGSRRPLRTMVLRTDQYGFAENHGAVAGETYHRLADSPTHAQVRQLSDQDQTASAAAAFGGYAQELGRTSFILRPGEEIDLGGGEDGPATMTRLEALGLIRNILGRERLTVLEAQLIAKRLGEEPWDRDRIEALAREMKNEAPEEGAEVLAGVAG